MPVPRLFVLHGLGLSARAADPLVAHLPGFDVVGLDLPGHGGTPATASTVDDLADAVVAAITASLTRAPTGRWVLAGHSMGGKVATVVASRVLGGEEHLFGLAGLVLMAASPLSPEPMEEERRARMLGWVDDGPVGPADARTFVDANTAGPLAADLDAQALDDVRRAAPQAWSTWLRRGSLEDHTSTVGPLDLPALVLAGAEDGDLGEEAQRELVAPALPRAHVRVVDDAAHLLTLEQPARVAAAITDWWCTEAGTGPEVPADLAALLAGPRTAARTRRPLASRVLADDPAYAPQVLDDARLATLRAVAEQVVPQDGVPTTWIDLAARVDAQLATGVGDGWRHDGQPVDAEAYRAGLDALAGLADLDGAARDERLRSLGEDRWFEDCRADLVRQWLAHPATMARIGFDGIAGGGDGRRQQGFTEVRIGRREDWEPRMEGARRHEAAGGAR